jgi:small subunit ribosomal protein S4
MARYLGAVCKRCRRYGAKLYLKGEKCYTDKCAVETRSDKNGNIKAPGEGPKKRRTKPTDYALQLKEKQKVKNYYGVLERQFRLYFAKANKKKGITSQNLVDLLESRLDNAVYRLGFASSRQMARQMVRNGYFTVNGKNVNIPSYGVKLNEVIKIKEKYANNKSVSAALNLMQQRGYCEWITFNDSEKSGSLNRLPSAEEVNMPVDLQMVVELYSK